MSDALRAEFERIYGKNKQTKEGEGLDMHRLPHGGYRSMVTHYAWDAFQRAPRPASTGAWQPIETAPHLKPVLIAYKNEFGRSRVIKARFVPRFTEEYSYDDGECVTEYNEESDTYTLNEGWYEQIDNWGDYSEVAVNYQPTNWQPLPELPNGDHHD